MRRRQAYYELQPPKEVIPLEVQETTEARKGREEVLVKLSCPKCGKTLGRGAHFHIKACRG